LFRISPQLVVESASPTACQLLHRKADEIIGKRIGDFIQHEPLVDVHLLLRNQPELVRAFPAKLAAPVPENEAPVAVTLHAMLGAGGAIVGHVCAISRVYPETLLLPNFGGVIVEPSEFLAHLTRGFAHKFNNILTIMSGYNELLQMETKPGTTAAESVDQIGMACKQANGLIDFLLKTGAALGVDFQNVHSTALLEKITRQVPLMVNTPPHLETGGQDLILRTDSSRVIEIVAELVRNAGENGARSVWITSDTMDGVPGLRVRDDGVGIEINPPESIFFVGITTKIPPESAGLGLSAAQGSALALDGCLSLHSTSGSGTEFFLGLQPARG